MLELPLLATHAGKERRVLDELRGRKKMLSQKPSSGFDLHKRASHTDRRDRKELLMHFFLCRKWQMLIVAHYAIVQVHTEGRLSVDSNAVERKLLLQALSRLPPVVTLAMA